MAYEFKTLGSVEALTEVPENAHALVEVDGEIKRVPGGALGNKKEESNNAGEDWDIKFIVDNHSFNWDGLSELNASDISIEEKNREEIFDKVRWGKPVKVCLVGGAGSEGRVYTPVSVSAVTGSGYRYMKFQFVDIYYSVLQGATIELSVDYGDIEVHIDQFLSQSTANPE